MWTSGFEGLIVDPSRGEMDPSNVFRLGENHNYSKLNRPCRADGRDERGVRVHALRVAHTSTGRRGYRACRCHMGRSTRTSASGRRLFPQLNHPFPLPWSSGISLNQLDFSRDSAPANFRRPLAVEDIVLPMNTTTRPPTNCHCPHCPLPRPS